MPTITSVVVIGRLMKSSEMLRRCVVLACSMFAAVETSSSRRDDMTLAVGFSPRIDFSNQSGRVATVENHPIRESSVATRRIVKEPGAVATGPLALAGPFRATEALGRI